MGGSSEQRGEKGTKEGIHGKTAKIKGHLRVIWDLNTVEAS